MATTTRAAFEGQMGAAAAAAADGAGDGDGDAAAALLVVIGELQSADERDLALQRIVDGKQRHFRRKFQRRQLLNRITFIRFLFILYLINGNHLFLFAFYLIRPIV